VKPTCETIFRLGTLVEVIY